jgi:hypothetical protein
VERFTREAQLLAELRDPGIVGFVASGVTPSGEPYLVMQWLDGESLSDRLDRGPLSVAETVALGRRVAGALHAAHARGVVHRDLKPSNLFLPGGDLARVMILDFGIARIVEEGRTLTRTGTTLGSPGYMSPEQARGMRVEASADVFSLGCVLFRCLAGQPPFTGDALTAMIKAISDPAPLVASFRADVPPPLEALIQRMLSKQPGARPRDAAAVAVELGAIAEGGLPTSVPSLPPPTLPATAVGGPGAFPSIPPAPTLGTTVAASAPARSRASIVILAALGGVLVTLAGVVTFGFWLRSGAAGGGGVGAGCPGIKCVPMAYPDHQHVDPMEVLPHATQLAQSIDHTASLCDLNLGGVSDGTVVLGPDVRAMNLSGSFLSFQFTRPSAGKALLVNSLPGRLYAVDSVCAHPVAPPVCTPRAAYRAAIASGVPAGTRAGMNYHNDDTLGPTWEFYVTNHLDWIRRIDGKTCAIHSKAGK